MRPRVLIAAPFPPPTTGQSLVTEMAADALADVADVVRVDTADRTRVWRRPWAIPSRRAARWAATLSRVRDVLRSESIDAVYLTPASSALGLLRDVLMVGTIPRGTPIVAHVHVGDYGRLLGNPVLGPIARAIARRFSVVITPSAYAAARIRAVFPEADLRVVLNTVRPALRFTPAEVEGAWEDRRAGKPVVLFLSNMIPSKGYERLAEAVPHLQHDVEVVFAGAWSGDDEREAFEARLGELGVDARVCGGVGRYETKDLFRSASVFAFPSTYPHESLPLAVLEAKAAGCAVVAFDHAGLREMVRDGIDGRLIAPGTPRDLARALDDAVAKAEVYGHAGALDVREAFAPEAFCTSLARIVIGLSSRRSSVPA